MRLLLAEDEKSLSKALTAILEKSNYSVDAVYDGEEALSYLDAGNYDGVILDIMMPKLDGLSVLRKIRETGNLIPVLILTAKSEIDDKVSGLDLGANDYLTKPFAPKELLARIRTALRHTRTQAADPGLARTGIYRCGRLRVDFDSHLVWLGEENVHLTQSEYRIVALLTQYAGKVLTYDFIIREIWGPNAVGDTQNLRANMAKIRRKLEKNPAKPQYIFTEVGVGYRMAEGD